MSMKPIFCVTHPRACSTAFERVFMTRKDLVSLHEPFGDAYYFGPERLGSRYEDQPDKREESGFSNSTYKSIFDRIKQEGTEGKRIFIKDIIYYLVPPNGIPPQIAPSLLSKKRGIGTESNKSDSRKETNQVKHEALTNGNSGHNLIRPPTNESSPTLPFPYGTPSEPGNPTVIPRGLLETFHFTFLIRDPHYSIPSFQRCTVEPLTSVTGWNDFHPAEEGYDDVRRMFDFIVATGQAGPRTTGRDDRNAWLEEEFGNAQINGSESSGHKPYDICVIDADDMLDRPRETIELYCQSTGLEFKESMLHWADAENQDKAKKAFEKWIGWHDDAIQSTELRARTNKKNGMRKTEAEFDLEWTKKYGLQGANRIREAVDRNMPSYNYLKQFAMRVQGEPDRPIDIDSDT